MLLADIPFVTESGSYWESAALFGDIVVERACKDGAITLDGGQYLCGEYYIRQLSRSWEQLDELTAQCVLNHLLRNKSSEETTV